jgi:hypothetical protein
MTNVMEAGVRAAPQGDASNITAATRFIETKLETYAYRRLGGGAAPPLVFLQHFTGTLDNWDPAVTDTLAQGREVILFESAGVGRSTGEVPDTIQGMAAHLLAFAAAGSIVATAPPTATQPGTRKRPGIRSSRRRSRESAGCVLSGRSRR